MNGEKQQKYKYFESIILQQIVTRKVLPDCFLSSVAILENNSDNVSVELSSEIVELLLSTLFPLKESNRLLNFGLFKGEVFSHDEVFETTLETIFQRSFAALLISNTLYISSSLRRWHSAKSEPKFNDMEC